MERSGSAVTDTTIVILVLLLGGMFWLFTWLPSLGLRQEIEEWLVPGQFEVQKNPLPLSEAVLVRAHHQYRFTCAKCHGHLADGNGPQVQLLVPRPRNFSHPEVQNQTDGAIFYKIWAGRGDMPEYGSRTSEEEIWELVWYVRAAPHMPGFYNETNPDDLVLNPGIVPTVPADTTLTPIPLIAPDR